MARYTDKHHQDIQLNLGNLVYVLTEHFLLASQLSCKLASCWVGPFPISGIASWVAYHINFLEKYGCIHLAFHVSYLHTHVGLVPTHPSPPLPLNDDATSEFEVEGILDPHLDCYGIEYIIKWIGYTVFEAT